MHALRSAMRRLFANPETARRLGQRARSDVEKLTWSAVTSDLSRSIARMHAEYHAGNSRFDNGRGRELIIALAVMDDEPAGDSLDYLRSVTRGRPETAVLALFTRYAQLRDVVRARRHGFVTYRWNGTAENLSTTARSIFGEAWVLILNPGEKIHGEIASLVDFLDSLPADIDEVTLPVENGGSARLIHVRPPGDPSGKVEYEGISIG
jgi:hypothetical protein